MPTDTFFNLAEEKRQRILDAAIDEFVNHPFHQATVNRIVQKADIPKGSFYQYFQDKKDLFKHILNIAGKKKLQVMSEVIRERAGFDFFQTLRDLYLAAIEFARKNPQLALIGQRILNAGDVDLKGEIFDDALPRSEEFLKELLQRGIDSGNLNPEIDKDVVTQMLISFNLSIINYLFKDKEAPREKEFMRMVDEMLYVIKNGIKQ